MNDVELLALAAKAAIAAGVKLEPYLDQGDSSPRWACSDRGITLRWDPLTSDGDAFRLAVVLGIDFKVTDTACHISLDDYTAITIGALYAGDIHAATRLAIVRAAADIGRATP